MAIWTAKDPDAVQDYLYTIPLDAGDSVDTYALAKISGDVVIDSETRNGADVKAWLSGGTAGETNVFRISWTTLAGRRDDDIITLAIISHEYVALALTGYAKPLVAHLQAKYPSFADVSSTTIAFWLTDAERSVDASWSEGDYAAAIMALAAHNMTLEGLGTTSSTFTGLPAGLTSMKSADLSLTFTTEAANGRSTGALGSTRYGAEYLALLRRNRGGPMVMPTGAAPYADVRWPQGE